MRKFYLFTLGLFLTFTLSAQTIDQVSIGAGYATQTFYTLSDGSTQSNSDDAWDIAFNVSLQGSGVFVNEGLALSMTQELPEVELYETASDDFENIDTLGQQRIYNNEVSWAAGAFNHIASETDPFDLGWGAYNPATTSVTSNRIFAIKLRSGTFKKLEIQSLISGVYTFRYANLDGSDEVTTTIAKSDYTGKTLAYYSLETDEALDLEPAVWDLKFTRYKTLLPAGPGVELNYLLTGTLSNDGVEVAQVDGIDPLTVSHLDYEDSYSDTLTVIGHDWKNFDLDIFQWVIPSDRVYFVKSTENELWKVQFLDFEGSSTGVSTFEKSFITELTSTEDTFEALNSFSVFPNPAVDVVTVAFELEHNIPNAVLQLSNTLGQILQVYDTQVQSGLNIKELPIDVPSGMYYVSLRAGTDIITKPVLVK